MGWGGVGRGRGGREGTPLSGSRGRAENRGDGRQRVQGVGDCPPGDGVRNWGLVRERVRVGGCVKYKGK